MFVVVVAKRLKSCTNVLKCARLRFDSRETSYLAGQVQARVFPQSFPPRFISVSSSQTTTRQNSDKTRGKASSGLFSMFFPVVPYRRGTRNSSAPDGKTGQLGSR